MKNNISMSLLLLLASIFAMSPFAIDSYLSAIPVIADDLNTQTSLVAVTVSIYILGLAMGQLLGGPLSDRWGRRPSTILGLLVFAIGSVLLANVQSIEMLWIWRIVQSIGGGIAVVNVPAIIRDNAIGKEAARLFSLIALIMMIAPAIAPTIGTVILHTLSWHWIFIMLSLVAVIVAIAAFRIMPDTKRAKKVKPSGGFLSVLKERRALGYLIAQGFGYAVMMTFIANAPFAYIEHFHVSPELFSGLFIAN
ncbi:MAG: DHA1 family bicyclomycin/chloramphenicol resistance-like MFS transporter, partial [Psychromonas sp.]|uniref:Bcr/CflA family efflux MFS transporter n=1 Tax=Psychromonas sp. TaxID=1884585 RepID=UPI0039E2D534